MTEMTMRGTEDFMVAIFVDRNGRKHLLTRWPDGCITLSWDWKEPINWTEHINQFKYYANPAYQDFLRLADSWQEYLDAVVEKE